MLIVALKARLSKQKLSGISSLLLSTETYMKPMSPSFERSTSVHSLQTSRMPFVHLASVNSTVLKKLLVQFEQDYPGVATMENVNDIAGNLQKSSGKASILEQLRRPIPKREDPELTPKPKRKRDLER